MSVLELGRQELLTKINEIPEAYWHARISDDSWTVLEVLEHLVLIEKVIKNQFENLLRDGVDRETHEHPVHRSAKRYPAVEAPDYVQPTGAFQTLIDAKGALDQSRQNLLQVLEQVEDREILKKRAFKHPYFGHMQLIQWLDFIGYHERRHLEQIKEILEISSQKRSDSKVSENK
ncbi:DinB family protein [Pseudalkalibacillus berkeleyi]|uniref:DinB family protein n=1 Tax=Pseudalkalibacillus berkeleyi TaxID=1069813 RepID=A0ABS9H3A0_9BACL|nr:DinB family protein [Pseudalkalibacillus berkeleyi]MCF6138586.1 DinB family protein [Pseudalkalibacillus berkeleyi]